MKNFVFKHKKIPMNTIIGTSILVAENAYAKLTLTKPVTFRSPFTDFT